MAEPKHYIFSTHIGAARAKQFKTFADLAEKLNIGCHRPDAPVQCEGAAI
jgi:hypothetical protein